MKVQVRASAAVAGGDPVLVVECDQYGVWHLSAAVDGRRPPSGSPEPERRRRYPAATARAGAAALSADPTLHQLDGLLVGWLAYRAHPGAGWTRSPA
ncbi:hypothetical protein JOF36_007562 [Pseudonocardia parietis]|uniref:Uncharacterized protein n=1 Tax=Pseudonocardia parietis TaxID=570936 RepID=A0ABS4W6F2_9PSEU|nr:hypothetical protein [Pseudonocardia parietis]